MPPDQSGPSLVVVLDVANVMGSRPDGWWRDRAGAAEGLLAGAAAVLAGGGAVTRVVAVLEGLARSARPPVAPGLDVVLAEADGDADVVATAQEVIAHGGSAWVVTADRGLRERLPAGAEVVGPKWWLDLVEAVAGSRG